MRSFFFWWSGALSKRFARSSRRRLIAEEHHRPRGNHPPVARPEFDYDRDCMSNLSKEHKVLRFIEAGSGDYRGLRRPQLKTVVELISRLAATDDFPK
jgi:hypothetical protein